MSLAFQGNVERSYNAMPKVWPHKVWEKFNTLPRTRYTVLTGSSTLGHLHEGYTPFFLSKSVSLHNTFVPPFRRHLYQGHTLLCPEGVNGGSTVPVFHIKIHIPSPALDPGPLKNRGRKKYKLRVQGNMGKFQVNVKGHGKGQPRVPVLLFQGAIRALWIPSQASFDPPEYGAVSFRFGDRLKWTLSRPDTLRTSSSSRVALNYRKSSIKPLWGLI